MLENRGGNNRRHVHRHIGLTALRESKKLQAFIELEKT
jgi:hypothetical protein